MKDTKCLWDRGFQGGSSGERKTAFSELGENDKFSVVFLSSVFITSHVGAYNRLAQATRDWSHAIIILICLASVATHFPTASAEMPRVGGIGTKNITEL